jgi:SAM-dependent methyltransferase
MNTKVNFQKSADIKYYFKKWPRLYYFVVDYFSPSYWGGVGPKEFLRRYPTEGSIVNLGSGPRKIAVGVINVDLEAYDGVDVVAHLNKLPFETGSVERILCMEVLEHVEETHPVISEMYRIMAPGAVGYVHAPLLYPFHASPSDYYRWTHVGLTEVFKDFTILEIGVRSGPFSLLAAQLCYLSASLFSFGNERLYWILVSLSTFLFFPIKYLDVVGNRLPFAKNCAADLYIIFEKANQAA